MGREGKESGGEGREGGMWMEEKKKEGREGRRLVDAPSRLLLRSEAKFYIPANELASTFGADDDFFGQFDVRA